MKFVGVDIAKQTNYACVTSHNNKVLTPPFVFQNDIDGLINSSASSKGFLKTM